MCDTVGHATPQGVKALVSFVKEQIVKGQPVKVDWHGHRDRGMGLINCLAAIEAGVDRVHATGLGVGERVGNAEMDLLLINLKLLGAHRHDLTKIPDYVHLASRACVRRASLHDGARRRDRRSAVVPCGRRDVHGRWPARGHGRARGVVRYFTSLSGMTSARGSGPNSSPNLTGGRSWNMKSHFHRSDGFDAWSQCRADTGRENAIDGSAA